MRLEGFFRESVLPRAHPHAATRRRGLEVLGGVGGLCTARRVKSNGDYLLCTLDVGRYTPDGQPPFKNGNPGWHGAGASIWNDSGAACVPHAAI